MKRCLTEKEIDTVVYEYSVARIPIKKIALKYFLCRNTIRRYLKSQGVYCGWDKILVDVDSFIKDWNSGMTCEDLKKKHNLSTASKIYFLTNKYRKEGKNLHRRKTNGRIW